MASAQRAEQVTLHHLGWIAMTILVFFETKVAWILWPVFFRMGLIFKHVIFIKLEVVHDLLL